MKNDRLLLIGGVLAIILSLSISFFLGKIWLGYFTAFTISVIYLFFLDRIVISGIESSSSRKIIRIFIILLVAVQLYMSILNVQRAEWQTDLLVDLRTNIISEIAQTDIKLTAHNTLKQHYKNSESQSNTLESSFREVLNERLLDDGTLLPDNNDESDISYSYEISTPDSIIVRAVGSFSKGENPEHTNHNNDTGMFRAIAILTTNGVSYEREN